MKTITRAEVARRLGVSAQTVSKMHDQLPGAVVINNRVRYLENAIVDFITAGGCRKRGASDHRIT